MRLFWVRDRINQGQFFIRLHPGKGNRADYFTNHHAPSHHKVMHPLHVQ